MRLLPKTVRRLPIFRLLAAAEIGMLLRRHVMRLSKQERSRLSHLVRKGPRMTREERAETLKLVEKMDPKLLAWRAVDKASPVPVPRRYIRDRPGS